MENLNSSSVKASDMVPEVYVGPISAEIELSLPRWSAFSWHAQIKPVTKFTFILLI